jgi:choline dehydrogenase-like flavoprotein
MSESTVAIIGSGIAGATVAYLLASRGYDVTIFEKGPDYPYPHASQFQERVLFDYSNPAYRLPGDLRGLTSTGSYKHDFASERIMLVGGSATQWAAIALRMQPHDFRTRSLYNYGDDWPITYDDLEPYYCRAEAHLGVSGTDADNPFAPPRSRPFPLPPFELSHDDVLLAERLRQHDILMHTTPQARTRLPYEQRPACANFGTCSVCPIGARYSPRYHLELAMETGRCTLKTNVSVRRIVTEPTGQARALVYQQNDSKTAVEHAASIIVVAAGAIESARLLLASTSSHASNGLGNAGGHLGQHFSLHHIWRSSMRFREQLYPGRIGAYTGQTHQFLDGPARGQHGGIKVELPSSASYGLSGSWRWSTGAEIVEELKPRRHYRPVVLHAESPPSDQKYVTLSDKRDRFGDPLAHVHYQSSEFDQATHRYASQLFRTIADACGAERSGFPEVDNFHSGHHHMGTCRMGYDPGDSVVDSLGRIHGTSGLFVVGASTFVGPSGGVNPTLTIVALAIRTADYILDQAARPASAG